MSMEKSGSTVINQCLNVQDEESVVVITDAKRRKIAESIVEESRKVAKNTVLMDIEETDGHGSEPPIIVSEAMKKADVVVAPTTFSLSHTKARIEACSEGARIATMPGITKKMFKTTLRADYEDIRRRCEKLLSMVKDSETISVKTPSGTDLKLDVREGFWHKDTGIIHEKGSFGNLPAGEVDGAPINMEGKIVVDFFKSGGNIFAPSGTIVEISGNRAVSIDRECDLSRAFENVKNGDNIAELGIGTNPEAELVGNILQDEKVLGTCHVAFGDSTSYGTGIDSEIHWDAILKSPTIMFDDKTIMEKGDLKVSI